MEALNIKSDKENFLDCLRAVKYVFSKHIKDATGLSPRKQRAIAHELRVDGYPIGSGDKGYYLCETPEEANSYIARERASMKTRNEGINAMEKSVDKMFNGQGDLF